MTTQGRPLWLSISIDALSCMHYYTMMASFLLLNLFHNRTLININKGRQNHACIYLIVKWSPLLTLSKTHHLVWTERMVRYSASRCLAEEKPLFCVAYLLQNLYTSHLFNNACGMESLRFHPCSEPNWLLVSVKRSPVSCGTFHFHIFRFYLVTFNFYFDGREKGHINFVTLIYGGGKLIVRLNFLRWQEWNVILLFLSVSQEF